MVFHIFVVVLLELLAPFETHFFLAILCLLEALNPLFLLLQHHILIELIQLLVRLHIGLHRALVFIVRFLLLASPFDSSNGLVVSEIVCLNVHDLPVDVFFVLADPLLLILASNRLQVLTLAVFFRQQTSHHLVCGGVRLSSCYKLLFQDCGPFIIIATLVTRVVLLLSWRS